MRHAVKGKQLNRDYGNRRALFKNLMLALIEHGQIQTTAAKAKAIQSSFEKLVTKAKVGDVHNRRMIDEVLNQRDAVNRLVDEIAPSCKRTSGYTRIVKLGNRRGDDAMMVRLEILDWQPKVVAAPEKTVKTPAKAEVKTEETKTTSVAPVAKEAPVSKVKQPAASKAPAKRLPQKRISGGK